MHDSREMNFAVTRRIEDSLRIVAGSDDIDEASHYGSAAGTLCYQVSP